MDANIMLTCPLCHFYKEKNEYYSGFCRENNFEVYHDTVCSKFSPAKFPPENILERVKQWLHLILTPFTIRKWELSKNCLYVYVAPNNAYFPRLFLATFKDWTRWDSDQRREALLKIWDEELEKDRYVR